MLNNTGLLVALLIVHTIAAEDIAARFRRKVGSYEGMGPVEYMDELRRNMSSPDGAPNDLDHNPTSVWCLLDRGRSVHIAGAMCCHGNCDVKLTFSPPTDVLNDQYHAKSLNIRCQLEQSFVFNLTSLIKSNSRHLPLAQAKLRTYMQPFERFRPKDNHTSIDVEVSIYTKIMSSINHTHCSGSVLALRKNMTVNRNTTDGWIEWNITNGILDCWVDKMTRDTLEVTVNFRLHKCVKGNKKVPIMVVDPATIPINQKTRRDRHWPLQPLVIFVLDDKVEREQIKAASAKHKPDEPVIQTTIGNRNKRSFEECRLHNMTVRFYDVHLTDIIMPLEYNAYQCNGGCNPFSIKFNDASNHARIISTMYFYHSEKKKSFRHIPRTPSCVAVEHKALAVVQRMGDGTIATVIYPQMIASRCECRA